MLPAILLMGLFSQNLERSIVPEIEIYYSASDRGGIEFKNAAEKLLTRESNSTSGGAEKVYRIGCAVIQPLSARGEVMAGIHLGYASGNSQGDAVWYGDSIHPAARVGERLDMQYLLAEVQVGARYWLWSHVGIEADLDLERGLWGKYRWESIDGTTYQSGTIGQNGESLIKFPIRFIWKIGPVFNVADYGWIYPWIGQGYAPLMTADSRLVSSSLGLQRHFTEDDSYAKFKFGIKVGVKL